MNESLRRFIITYSWVLLLLCLLLIIISVWPFPEPELPKNRPNKAIQPQKQPEAQEAAQPGDGLGGKPIDSDNEHRQRISDLDLENREARDHFVGAKVLAEKITPLENGKESRARLLQMDDFAFPILVEEEIRTDAEGRIFLSSQKAMVANRLLIVPSNETPRSKLRGI